ncbi:MAG: hypothetical protein CVV58_06195 [Tenericutes bacterium HGW-Tenericutes-3]|nr:MAG: hypothetical protein CVV58_06195 [Tenericutes bacterium HGW-Tenericutes-3]
MELLILVGVVSGFILLYIGTMYLNDRVKVPESCKAAYLEAQSCESCASRDGKSSCNFNDTLEFLKEVKL